MYMNIYQWGRARSACGGIDTTQYAHTSREDSIFTCFETTQFAHSCVETALCRPVCRNNTVCVCVCRKKTVLSIEDCKRKVSCMRIVCAYCLCGYCAHTCHTQYTVFYIFNTVFYTQKILSCCDTRILCVKYPHTLRIVRIHVTDIYADTCADTCHTQYTCVETWQYLLSMEDSVEYRRLYAHTVLFQHTYTVCDIAWRCPIHHCDMIHIWMRLVNHTHTRSFLPGPRFCKRGAKSRRWTSPSSGDAKSQRLLPLVLSDNTRALRRCVSVLLLC